MCATHKCYSHLKHFTAIPEQAKVTHSITMIGNKEFSTVRPRNVAFIIWMPWVKGNTLIILCMASGIISKGKVAPEKMSMGKYRTQAITLALLAFLAMPPTIMPMLNVERTVRSQLPANPLQAPCK